MLAVAMLSITLQGLTWHLDITSVSQASISGILSATNDSQTAVSMDFPYLQWSTMLLDGQAAPMLQIPAFCQVTVNPNETIQEGVYYSLWNWIPAELIPTGQHIVRGARMALYSGETGWVGVGNYVPVTVYETYHFLDFDLQVEHVSADSMSFYLSTTNNDVYPFTYPSYTNWTRLQINNIMQYYPNNGWVTIAPGQSRFQRLVYNPTPPIPDGTYQISLALQDYDSLPAYNVPGTLSVTIGPSAVIDEVVPELFLSAYPNPFADKVKLSLKSETAGRAAVSIYNTRGQLVRYEEIGIHAGENTYTWDGNDSLMRTAPRGMYIFKISSASSSKTIKSLKLQ
jgi:hypothetical protein